MIIGIISRPPIALNTFRPTRKTPGRITPAFFVVSARIPIKSRAGVHGNPAGVQGDPIRVYC